MDLNRRQAIIRMAAAMGATLVGSRLLATSLGAGPRLFTPAEVALLDEIGDTIIPPTDVPGAKAVGIGGFMAMMIADCYYEREQRVFSEGLAQLAAGYRTRFGTDFVAGKPADRTTYLNELDSAQRAHERSKKRDEPPHYFRIMKELTLLGYFTSEIGCTQALRYEEVPGRYDPDAPYQKGDRAWAPV